MNSLNISRHHYGNVSYTIEKYLIYLFQQAMSLCAREFIHVIYSRLNFVILRLQNLENNCSPIIIKVQKSCFERK